MVSRMESSPIHSAAPKFGCGSSNRASLARFSGKPDTVEISRTPRFGNAEEANQPSNETAPAEQTGDTTPTGEVTATDAPDATNSDASKEQAPANNGNKRPPGFMDRVGRAFGNSWKWALGAALMIPLNLVLPLISTVGFLGLSAVAAITAVQGLMDNSEVSENSANGNNTEGTSETSAPAGEETTNTDEANAEQAQPAAPPETTEPPKAESGDNQAV